MAELRHNSATLYAHLAVIETTGMELTNGNRTEGLRSIDW